MDNNEKRHNATICNNRDPEAEAAIKIQAGFRGYQVRKQLKNNGKIGSAGGGGERRSIRRDGEKRASSGNNEIEEKSATKIQAGVRGFLVRKRQKRDAKKNNQQQQQQT